MEIAVRDRSDSSVPKISIFGRLVDRLLRRVAILGFDLVILMGMAVILVCAALALGGRPRLFQATVILPLIIMIVAMVYRAFQNPASWRLAVYRIFRDWVPFLFIVFIYENMHDVAGQVMGFDFSVMLSSWDLSLFGVQPTIWAQEIFSPLLTDILSISYALYFALPLFIMFILSINLMRFSFRHIALSLTLTFILGFLGYVFLPASPPRYFMESLYTNPHKLYGLFIYNRLQGAWDGLSVVSGGAFPSLHVGISAVALIYAFRFRKAGRIFSAIWYIYVPIILSLWFSTVYLRHHWVMDIIAGVLVALSSYFGAAYLMRVWNRLRSRYNILPIEDATI